MRLIFIVGAPRSGTTLLQNLVSCHPDIASAPETHFFAHATPTGVYERGLPPIGKRPIPDPMAYDDAARLITRLSAAMHLDGTVAAWLDPLASSDGIPVRALAESFFACLGGDAPIFLEKSPPHVFFLPEILRVFPNASIVNIVRDPRDVIASINRMLKGQGKPPRSVYERVRTWNASVDCAQQRGLFTIRYEDLVANRAEVMRRVFNHLGLEFKEQWLQAYSMVTSQTVRDNETWKVNNRAPTSDAMVGKFKNQLTNDEISMTEWLCRRHMQTWRYAPSGTQGSRARLARDRNAYYAMRTRRLADALLGRLL